MKFAYASDIHIEFCKSSDNQDRFLENVGDFDSDAPNLILAGDICESNNYKFNVEFFDMISEKYQYVFMVKGNHEFYGDKIDSKIVDEFLMDYSNIVLLDNSSFQFNEEGILIVGATLWTDIKKNDPTAVFQVRTGMNDYNLIENERGHKLTPTKTISLHFESKKYIFEEINKFNGDKVVVVTHTAPCSLSIDARYQSSLLNYAYFSDLSNEILDITGKKIIWIHGHVHTDKDYMVGDNCRVLANPFGYFAYESNYRRIKEFEL